MIGYQKKNGDKLRKALTSLVMPSLVDDASFGCLTYCTEFHFKIDLLLQGDAFWRTF